MKKQLFLLTMIIVLLLAVVASCATTVGVHVTRPAEVSIGGVKIIAVSEVQGARRSHAIDLTDAFTAKLTQANYFDSVIDRQNLAGIIKEQNLTLSGMVDDDAVVKIGKFIGAAVLVFGRITVDNYDEVERSEVEKRYDATTKKNYNVTVYKRTGTYTLSVNVQVTDAESARVIGAKSLKAVKIETTEADNQVPESINSTDLYLAAVEDLADSFMKFIVPYQEIVQVELLPDSKLPQFDTAIKLIKTGDLDGALEIAKELAMQDFVEKEVQSKAFYNYGILLVYSGRFDEGLRFLNNAFKVQPNNDLYSQAIRTARFEKSSAEKLQQQLKSQK